MRWALSLLLGLSLAVAPSVGRAYSYCTNFWVTGYVRGHGNNYTYDGTSVWSYEPIAAASWEVPIDAYVSVDGLGTYRIADRGGGLYWRHIDILVDTVWEAYELTGSYYVCVAY